MYSFRNDYSAGAHPQILEALVKTNEVQTCGYGLDSYCKEAADLIRTLCVAPKADVHFLVGGTQVNMLAIQSFLRSYEAVIAADTAHISVHETGAIEACGHKICTVPSHDGKLTPAMVESVVNAHSSEHMVLPKLVYISDTTELGTIYTRDELYALRLCCDKYGLYLYVDGARLGSALTAPGNDMTLQDLASLTDAFSIGGTKNGLFFGEALVFSDHAPNREHFRWHMKQRGALLAKGRLLGIQFKALMSDDLFFEIGRHENAMALRLRDGFDDLGYSFFVDSPSNQQFPILPDNVVQQLLEMGYEFEEQHLTDIDAGHTCVRFVTSWVTPESAVDTFLQDLASCER